MTGPEQAKDAEPEGTGDETHPGAPEPRTAEDGAADALAREVYWAGDGISRLSADVGSLVERLDAYTHQRRVEQRQLVPGDQSLLMSAVGWKRTTKLFIWRLTRFSTMRYDRLISDLAEMNAELARRLLKAEEELARLRDDLESRGGARS